MAVDSIAYNYADEFREKHGLGNYFGKTISDLVDKLDLERAGKIMLIRRPFRSEKLAGFIAYKHDYFIIVTNTNKSIGNERFTIAHEIYHILENSDYIVEKKVLEELDPSTPSPDDFRENMANRFAAQLLMPKKDIEHKLGRLISKKNNNLEEDDIIKLQQLYGVDYTAMVKRLDETGIIDDNDLIKRLIRLADDTEELKRRTVKLGYSNEVNTQSKAHNISIKYLEIIKNNFENGNTDFDELVRIFDYLGCTPEEYGYQKYTDELSDKAKAFIDNL